MGKHDEADADYRDLIAELDATGRPWHDKGYAYMNLDSRDVAKWLRTEAGDDVYRDDIGSSDVFVEYVARVLDTPEGDDRTRLKCELASWLMSRALILASKSVADDINLRVREFSEAESMFLRRQA